ncbi:MAG: T9SS type A sorting domain-containing protein, partial [Rhodothermales bacterium]|nr:T9SS type A sorting domain-containing protein [Rhodothermales bacterium]
QNYPNPFATSTAIEFDVPTTADVRVAVFDILGREVVRLVSEQRQAGSYKENWNADGLASGVYFLRMEAGDFTAVKSLTVVK